MKLIILFLISFTAMAQTKVSIIPNDSKLASMSFEKDSLVDAKKHLKKIVRKSQWLKGSYQEDETDTIFSRVKTRSVATGTFKEERIRNIDTGVWEMVQVAEYADEEYAEYFKPSNFTVAIEDVTAERELKASEEASDKVLRGEVRKMNFKKKTSETVAEWRDRIGKGMNRLRKLVRE